MLIKRNKDWEIYNNITPEKTFINRRTILKNIVADRKPEKVHGNQQYSISDFEFHGNDLIFLTYEKTLKKISLNIPYIDISLISKKFLIRD